MTPPSLQSIKAEKQTVIEIRTQGKGLHSITDAIRQVAFDTDATGVIHLFVQHTSASLLIQENADPSAKRDLEEFIDRLVPEDQSWHRHVDEGPDDTVSHMKAAVTATSLTVPVRHGELLLGTWQGLYLWEHRRAPHTRRIVVTVLG